MAGGHTRTWTSKEIEAAIEKARLAHTGGCPRCTQLFGPLSEASKRSGGIRVKTIGHWTLSVGAADVIVTVPATCCLFDGYSSHKFILRVDLWRKARTPIGGQRVKHKIVFKESKRPRPLQFI